MPKMTYHDRNIAEVRTLQPGLQPLVLWILYKASRRGMDFLIDQAFRTKEEQRQEVLEGNSELPWPWSFHNHGAAVDIVPVLFGTFAVSWAWKVFSRFKRIATLFKQYNFEWGSDLWNGFDKPHMQYSKAFTIQDYIAGAQIDEETYMPLIKAEIDIERDKIHNGIKKARIAKNFKRERKLIAELDVFEDFVSMILA